MTGYVYRCYDPQGALIYIGSTIDVNARLTVGHRTEAWWYDQVARVDSTEFPTIAAAVRAEAAAIRAELPRWNVKHKPTHTDATVADMIESIENGPNPDTWHNRMTLARLRRRLALSQMATADEVAGRRRCG
jgi:hypothetical protein